MAARDPETGQFLQGVSGNPKGKPKGARTKLGEQFLQDLQADWEVGGPEAIVQVREEKPDAYLKVVASLLPRDLNVRVNPLEELQDDELIQRLRDLNDIIGPFLGTTGSGEDSDGIGPQTTH